ncbi:MMPL family transporter [Virgibacillus sp. NKC19-3]|uniref:MMPL family transporter n=1 Tax=Virgibacillus saliphilus TaxID=2831674 RepID=UPI001C9B4BF5|nr:MMPL family transporter [Virgibacillus sp. NKC19-3]MBY7142129.1 MMPL family transporter [Virgibacillus sp. NKC19-3]
MKNALQSITDCICTKRGMWITLGIWALITILLAAFSPGAHHYQVSSIEALPEDAPSIEASEKVDTYVEDANKLPALLVFESMKHEIELPELTELLNAMDAENMTGIEEVVPLGELPPQATEGFFSENGSTALIPIYLSSTLDTPEIKEILHHIQHLTDQHTKNLNLYVTGPAGIATDTNDLFSRADFVLIKSTVGIILALLVVIYRSPLLAFIPLVAAGLVYLIASQVLGLLGKAGLLMSTQTISIMTILLFAAVVDYSLFIFSRFREELKIHENKYDAMKIAMRGIGLPVFFSSATVLAAMLILIVASLGDYRNFAPIFGTTLVIIILASVTLVPALFMLFGRKSFWPLIPRVGQSSVKMSSFWSKTGRFVTKKPIMSVSIIGLFILVSASNILNLDYEFNILKSFPEDMPSREGYEIVEENFEAGSLAPTTVLFEGKDAASEDEQEVLMDNLSEQPLVSSVRLDQVTDDETVISYSMTFEENPYEAQTMDALETIQNDSDAIVKASNLNGDLFFAGETATSIDDRSLNNRDLILIIVLETILIFVMLIFLTKSFKMPLYMMGTILISFAAALGLGMSLTNLFFDIDTISNRVPVYAFIFLIALGIDYNIMLVSRFMEEREKYPVKKAVEIAVANTGGVISSAGVILAATFAVLMTQPIQLLFVFGFIVAVGILIDTFLIRGVLLPGLLVLFEKDKSRADL